MYIRRRIARNPTRRYRTAVRRTYRRPTRRVVVPRRSRTRNVYRRRY